MYGVESLKRVKKAVEGGKFSSSDNATILSDYLSLMKSGKVDYAELLRVLLAFTGIVKDTETLDMITTAITTMSVHIEDEQVQRYVGLYSKLFIENLFEELGPSDSKTDSSEVKKLRGTVVGLMLKIDKFLDEPLNDLNG